MGIGRREVGVSCWIWRVRWGVRRRVCFGGGGWASGKVWVFVVAAGFVEVVVWVVEVVVVDILCFSFVSGFVLYMLYTSR